MKLLLLFTLLLGGCSIPHKDSKNSLNLFHEFQNQPYLWNTKTHNPYTYKIDSLGMQTVIFIPLNSDDKEYLKYLEINTSIYSKYEELNDFYYFTQSQMDCVSLLLKNRVKSGEKFKIKGLFVPAEYVQKENSLEDSHTLNFPYKIYLYNFSLNVWALIDSLEINSYEQDSAATVQIEEILPVPKIPDIQNINGSKPVPSRIWKLDCTNDSVLLNLDPNFDFGYLDFYTNGEFASVLVTPIRQNGFYLLNFEALSGIARGNTEMNWNHFSRDSAVAVVCDNGNLMKFKWLGFYDSILKKRVFHIGPFNSDKNLIDLKKCN